MFKRLLLILLVMFCFVPFSQSAEKPILAINQFMNHPALDAAKQGLMDALKDRGYENKINIFLDNAQGNMINAVQIAKHHASLKPSWMVGIATPCAQANLKARIKGTWLGILAITDPQAAGLDKDPSTLGVTDSPPVEALLDVVLKVLPHTRTVGIIYNPGEVNSVKTVERIKNAAALKDIEVKTAVITNTANIQVAVQSLQNNVDVLYVPQDNLVVSAIDAIVSMSKKINLPVVGNDPSLIDKGLLLALGSNYYKSGYQLGNMIADQLDGKTVTTRIQNTNDPELVINEKQAKAFGITIPKLKDKEEV